MKTKGLKHEKPKGFNMIANLNMIATISYNVVTKSWKIPKGKKP